VEISMLSQNFIRSVSSLAVTATAGLLFAAAPANAASKGSIQKMEGRLAAAGFVARPANTPKRQAMIVRLPADKFATRTNGDTISYVYADPKVCNCIYVGDQQAYGVYQRAIAVQKLADEQRMTAEEFNDPAWEWGAWGMGGGRFGFGGRRGW
jgi:hypothetical protein